MARAMTPAISNAPALASYNAFGAAISAALQAVLTKTADTGQVSYPVATLPVSQEIIRDYEIYRFNDALQTASPIFIRVDYLYNVNLPAIRLGFRVGTGTDGAGNLVNPSAMFYAHAGGANSQGNVLVSNGDGSLLTFMQGVNSATPPTNDSFGSIVVERFRNADGTPNGDGVNTWAHAQQNTNSTNFNVGIQQSRTFASSTGWITEGNAPIFTPWPTGPKTAFSGSVATAFPFFTWGEKTLRGASQAILWGYTGDWPRNSEVNINHSGGLKKFWSTGTAISAQTVLGFTGFSPLFRYE